MEVKQRRVPTAIALNKVRPTDNQIAHNVIVVPKPFIDSTPSQITWQHSFEVEFMGKSLGKRNIDKDNRLRLPLKDALSTGDVVTLTVRGGTLCIDRA